MNKTLTSVVALTGLAAAAGAAQAADAVVAGDVDEPMLLTETQMDAVTAGGAKVSADLTGDAIVDGSFFLNNLPYVYSEARITATIFPYGAATLVLKAKADTFD